MPVTIDTFCLPHQACGRNKQRISDAYEVSGRHGATTPASSRVADVHQLTFINTLGVHVGYVRLTLDPAFIS